MALQTVYAHEKIGLYVATVFLYEFMHSLPQNKNPRYYNQLCVYILSVMLLYSSTYLSAKIAYALLLIIYHILCLFFLFQQVQELQGCLFSWTEKLNYSLPFCVCSPSQPLLDRSLPDFNTFSSVEDWLSAIKMSQYRENFLNSGFTSLQLVAQITSEWVCSLAIMTYCITNKTFQGNPVCSQADWTYVLKSLCAHTESQHQE